jgi:hypothetical protein
MKGTLVSVAAFAAALGAGGKPAPDHVPASAEPKTPDIVFVPKAPG